MVSLFTFLGLGGALTQACGLQDLAVSADPDGSAPPTVSPPSDAAPSRDATTPTDARVLTDAGPSGDAEADADAAEAVDACVAQTETCDGTDNDCDGAVDEGCSCVDGATQPCYSGAGGTKDVGECHGGTQTCVGGAWGACAGEVAPQSDTCNAKDDDCDGSTDENLGTYTCGQGECLRTQPSCTNGVKPVCVPGVPVAETCNAKDDDCDGSTDENLNDQPCSTGLEGVCGPGKTLCNAGVGSCTQTTFPGAESCNGKDDDCDDQTDENLNNLDCDTNLDGECAAGKTACVAGFGSCVQKVFPVLETCNGKDDDCDGAIDEGPPVCP